MTKPDFDEVQKPAHYNSHPSGVECITITRHMTFNIGNAIKYCWRAGLKKDATKSEVQSHITDLEKARWYIDDEIKHLRGELNDKSQIEIDFPGIRFTTTPRDLERRYPEYFRGDPIIRDSGC